MPTDRDLRTEAGKRHLQDYGGRFDSWERVRGEHLAFRRSLLAVEAAARSEAAASRDAEVRALREALDAGLEAHKSWAFHRGDTERRMERFHAKATKAIGPAPLEFDQPGAGRA